MGYWLLKSEPSSWSWDQQAAAGEAGTPWTGVRNHAAKNNLQAMRVGDEAFFYHSNERLAIVGLVQVIREYYLDPTDETGRFGMVDVKAVRALLHPVGLDRIKAELALKGMRLVTHSRLSVQPVTNEEWRMVCRMGGLPDAS